MTIEKKRSDLEQQRDEDAERGQHRDQRGDEQHRHHRALDPGAGAEMRRDPAVGEGAAGEGDQQGHREPDPEIEGDRLGIDRGERARLRVERWLGRAGGQRIGFAQHRRALHGEARQRRRLRARHHRLEDEAARNIAPDREEDERRHHRPERDVPAVIIGQRMRPWPCPARRTPSPCRAPRARPPGPVRAAARRWSWSSPSAIRRASVQVRGGDRPRILDIGERRRPVGLGQRDQAALRRDSRPATSPAHIRRGTRRGPGWRRYARP